MQFQTALDGTKPEVVFAVARNAYTKTLTASTIAKGEPVVLATATDSANGAWVTRAATATAEVNNLYIGCAHDFPGTASNKAWQPEDVGLVQIYGYDNDAVIQIQTSDVPVGSLLIPNSIRALIPAGSPTTHTTTATGLGVPGLAGHCVLLVALASSSATATGTAVVFHRAM